MIPDNFLTLVGAPYICARVVAQDRNSYRVITTGGEFIAELSGSLRYQTEDPSMLPVVGDYVEVSFTNDAATIRAVLPRQNLFSRRGVFRSHTMQAIAANIDRLFIVMAVGGDFNPRRLERYLVAAKAYDVPCAVVLNKIDLASEPESYVQGAQAVADDLPVLAVSALTRAQIGSFAPFCGAGRTIAFVGASGVGKSTLINTLLDQDILSVSYVRQSDERGRHTTTRRRLLYLPDGTALIDTPGMREFGLADATEGISQAFSDVASLASDCRFRDCQHVSEPGCAVRDAVDQDRLQNWRKLGREAAFEARKTDRLLAENERKKWRAIHKEAKQRRKP
jgi:ribosome biogenesis GTPase